MRNAARSALRRVRLVAVPVAALLAVSLSAQATPDRGSVRTRASQIFGTLPDEAQNPDNIVTLAKVELGRQLFFDPRLSKNQDISCNSCHGLDTFGVDGEPTSVGHRGQRGNRNSPSVYNAALHIAQFWDGRAADVEAQAKGPVLNPVEMAMPSEESVVRVLKSIPRYTGRFRAAFPQDADPISFDNMALAIAAFERRLMTPAPFDRFLKGDDSALTDAQVEGLDTFINVGCITCHMGPAVGGGMYRKLGLVKPYPTEDPGRFEVTGKPEDRGVFKVPSLRNVVQTGPYFHDGSIAKLDQAIRIMGEHQLGTKLTDDQVASIRSFLESLSGVARGANTTEPRRLRSGPNTPEPDPS